MVLMWLTDGSFAGFSVVGFVFCRVLVSGCGCLGGICLVIVFWVLGSGVDVVFLWFFGTDVGFL